jgi:hypothetical protein
MKSLTQLVWCLLALTAGSTGAAPVVTSNADNLPLDLSAFDLRQVYVNEFNQPQKIVREEELIERAPDGTWQRKLRPAADAEWIAEGTGGAEIRDGKLRLAPTPFDATGQPQPAGNAARSHMVVWNRHVFPADFLLAFEMSPCGSTNGLTIVFFSAAGKLGEDLFDLTLPPRRAEYSAYHSGTIVNYSDAYWSRNSEDESKSNRMRKNPGFELVCEGPSRTTGATEVTHRVRILKFGPRIEVEINGLVVCRWHDPGQPLGAGRVGLRSMSGMTMVAYDNFKVWAVSRKSPNQPK